MRLEEDPEEGDAGGGKGASRDEDGMGMETLDQVMPPMEKRETVREVPL